MTMTEDKRRRGRPRPAETVARDNSILTYLRENGPQTRNAIAEHFGLEKMVTWLSLDRLRKQGLVRTCAQQGGSDTLWSTAVDKPCP